MSKKIIKDVGASVKQKLLNFSKQNGRPFNEILQYYMIERFIHRLSRSNYKNRFVLKGALMFVVWDIMKTRATRDIDLLGKTKNTTENITNIIKEICEINCSEDAVVFDPDSVLCEPIQEQNEYSGIRANFNGKFDTSKSKMQIDIGFGDVVFPSPTAIVYPTMLGMPSLSILGYTPESVIAEKTHAIIRHGLRNSRMKDYFDIWVLSKQFLFDGKKLSEAIQQTFMKREVEISNITLKIFDDLLNDESKLPQWNAFINNNLFFSKIDFKNVISHLKWFIQPILEFSIRGEVFDFLWQGFGPWLIRT
jgi:hypothetical protein